MAANKFWQTEDSKLCNTCKEALETMEYLQKCAVIAEEQGSIDSILDEWESGVECI